MDARKPDLADLIPYFGLNVPFLKNSLSFYEHGLELVF
jgi:hypothetical protein